MDFISKFLTAIVNGGIIPKKTGEITTSDRFRRIAGETDRGGKRSISYWLKQDYDFAYGYAKDFKTGAEIRWNSAKNDPSMTKADITRINALMKARKHEEDIRIAERHTKIAARAKVKWGLATVAGETEYTKRKSIPTTHSGRVYGERNVILPIYELQRDGELDMVSWQMIETDGTKRFPFGGKKAGCFGIVGQINPTLPIVITEGWATAESVAAALGRGVVFALDAGNIAPVAKSLRSYYKTTPIIIAADNDENQAGQKGAAKAVRATPDCSIVICPEIGKDFNDLPPEAIRSAFGVEGNGGGVPDSDSQSQSVTPAANALDWQANLIVDNKNRIVSTSLQNAILYLIYHQDFSGVFAFDEFKQAILLRKQPPWEDGVFRVDRITDIQITQAAATLERYGINATIERTAKAIQVAADDSRFHSAREYFGTLEWDGVERLCTFALSILQCRNEPPEYLSFVFRKWMTAAVKRIMEPGCKFDHVLVLESQKQGLYKSAFLKTMATFNGETYHTDSVSVADIGSKDTAIKLQGNMIVELAELTGFNKQDDNIIKNWLTQEIDEVRLPYSRETSRYARQFVFAATTNNHDYLKDPTGNRRYWPVTIERAIDIALVNKIKSQLWAEAVALYKSGLYLGPTEEENALADTERNKRMQHDAWDEVVMNIVIKAGMDEFRVSDILSKMDLRTNEKTDKTMKRLATILKMNGYSTRSAWDATQKKTVRLWGKYDGSV